MADFSMRTNSVRAVELFDNDLPKTPDGKNNMDCLSIINEERNCLTFNIFNDNQFKDDSGNSIKHPEACLFIQDNLRWFCLIEIKDCKSKNVSNYNLDIKEKMAKCKEYLLGNNILDNSQKIYAIASYPRRKMSFDDSIFNNPFEVKKLLDNTGIIFMATNSIAIKTLAIERLQ